MNSIFLGVLCFPLVASIAAPRCSAAVIEVPISSGIFTNVTTGNFNVPKFDPSLGTLTQVVVNATSIFTHDVVAQNFSGSPASISYVFRTSIGVQVGIPSVVYQSTVNRPSQTIFVAGGGVAFIPAESFSITLASNALYTSPTALAAMTGLDNATGSITASTAYIETPASNPIFLSPTTTQFSVIGSIQYTFTPVPEPGVPVLTTIATLALAGIRRRTIC